MIYHEKLEVAGTWGMVYPPDVDVGQRGGARVGAKLAPAVSGGDRDDTHASSSRRLDSRGRVLDYDTIARRHRQRCGGHQVYVGTWLAVDHVFGTDQHWWAGQTRLPQALRRYHAGARCCNRPAFRR